MKRKQLKPKNGIRERMETILLDEVEPLDLEIPSKKALILDRVKRVKQEKKGIKKIPQLSKIFEKLEGWRVNS